MKKEKSVFREPTVLLIACALVGLLAARGIFSSMVGFPVILGLVCLVFGLLSLRQQPRKALGARLALILLAPALATAGFFVHQRAVDRSLTALQAEVSAALIGVDAPRLADFEALNVELAALQEAASYSGPATIVTFWQRWCSPCWKELPELEELYRRHSADGLRVIALTRYDQPEDEAAREKQLARDRDYVRKEGFTFPFAITAESSVHDGFQVRSVPSSALIDGNGKIVAYGVGLEGGRELMRRAAKLMGEG